MTSGVASPLRPPGAYRHLVWDWNGTLFDDAWLCVEVMDGLLVNFARERGAAAIVRGLRFVSDFEYELQLALMNYRLAPQVETLFFMPSAEYSYLNSSVIKEVARLGGDVSGLVPAPVLEALRRKFNR